MCIELHPTLSDTWKPVKKKKLLCVERRTFKSANRACFIYPIFGRSTRRKDAYRFDDVLLPVETDFTFKRFHNERQTSANTKIITSVHWNLLKSDSLELTYFCVTFLVVCCVAAPPWAQILLPLSIFDGKHWEYVPGSRPWFFFRPFVSVLFPVNCTRLLWRKVNCYLLNATVRCNWRETEFLRMSHDDNFKTSIINFRCTEF